MEESMTENTGTDSLVTSYDEIDVLDIVLAIWRQKITVFTVAVATFMLAVLYLHNATQIYTVYYKVTPANSPNQPTTTGQLRGLASLTGIRLPRDESTFHFTLYLEGLYGRGAAAEVSKRSDLMHEVFESEWDSERSEWTEPQGLIFDIKSAMKFILGIPIISWQVPSAARLQEYIEEEITILEDDNSQVVTISMDVESPHFGLEFLASLHQAVDQILRKKSVERAKHHVDYLTGQLTKVAIAEYREALIRTLAEQEKTLMMASSGLPFAADVFDQPVASLRPTKPKSILVLALSIIGGVGLGILIGLVRARLKN